MVTAIFNSVNKTIKKGIIKMGLYDRDWYKEGYEEKYKKYNGDFSLHSKPQKQKKNKRIWYIIGISIILYVILSYFR